MPQPEHDCISPVEARRRRLVWLAWGITLLVASVLYAHKAAEERSAFVRWRHQIHEFWTGTNIWDRYVFPNPPIMPIMMSPLMVLPPVVGAVCWFGIKAVMASLAVVYCQRMARGGGGGSRRGFPWWGTMLVILLSLRALLSDLDHGNINILILFLVVSCLELWRRGYDVASGVVLALAITVKVTPALFVPYFLYKRSWRTVGATFLGLGLFFVIVPSIVMGPEFNGQCLAMWWHRMLSPYVMGDFISPQEFNQSMGGVLTRLLVDLPPKSQRGYGGVAYQVNLLSIAPATVTTAVKLLSFALMGLLAVFCRTRTTRRDDPRLFGEFALVVLTMLFASERTWKHHYVTLVLPYAYLVGQMMRYELPRRTRRILAGSLALSAILIGSTSEAFGGWAPDGQGHEIALAYGMYFWGGVALYVATAWRVLVDGAQPDDAHLTTTPWAGPHWMGFPAPPARPRAQQVEHF